MARIWTIPFEPNAFTYVSSGASPDQVPTTLRPCAAFDASTDEAVIIEGLVPAELSAGTLYLDLLVCANTTTAADDARFDVVTEFRTPGATEAMNADNFDASADSGTATFSTTAYSLQLLTITLTPGTTPAAGDKFRIKITRDANNAGGLDDLAVDCLLVAAKFYEAT